MHPDNLTPASPRLGVFCWQVQYHFFYTFAQIYPDTNSCLRKKNNRCTLIIAAPNSQRLGVFIRFSYLPLAIPELSIHIYTNSLIHHLKEFAG